MNGSPGSAATVARRNGARAIDSRTLEVPRGRVGPRCRLSLGHQVLLVRATLTATVVAGLAAGLVALQLFLEGVERGSLGMTSGSVAALLVSLGLIYGNLTHQIASLGHLKRRMSSCSAAAVPVAESCAQAAPPVVILVPSYKENIHLVRQTLLSAGLQEYPDRRVVLLIDDPPYPSRPDELDGLLRARRLPRELNFLVSRQARPLQDALDGFLARRAAGRVDRSEETRRVARLYRDVSAWYLWQAAATEVGDHIDRLFVEATLLGNARSHGEHAEGLARRVPTAALTEDELLREYHQLTGLFRVEFTKFERKCFANLSHEPNKAMNLNSFIGLVGQEFRIVRRAQGVFLEGAAPGDGDLSVPDAKYIVVLDADSILLPGYVQRLVRKMEAPENRRLAVAQCPYMPVPGAPGLLERAAAATVAVQHVVHQGFEHFQATYWVGANAMLRKAALDEIRTPVEERGHILGKYIQDRTHIEDTESTIDLVERGWLLHNHPEPLAYSATPPDFGSLLIQRRRWANGGLIVLPRLVRTMACGRGVPRRWLQAFLRVAYLLNISLGSLCVFITLLVPLEGGFIPCLAVAGASYLLVFGADLARVGFRVRDLVHVYAVNLMLIPIHLGGACASLHQAWTGKKTPFARTPKVKDRTQAPLFYVLAEYGMLAFCFLSMIAAVFQGRIQQALWTLVNVLVLVHVVVNLMGDRGGPLRPRV